MIDEIGNRCDLINAKYFRSHDYLYVVMQIMDISLNNIELLKHVVDDYQQTLLEIKCKLINSVVCLLKLNYYHNDIYDSNVLLSFNDDGITVLLGNMDSMQRIDVDTKTDYVSILERCFLKIAQLVENTPIIDTFISEFNNTDEIIERIQDYCRA